MVPLVYSFWIVLHRSLLFLTYSGLFSPLLILFQKSQIFHTVIKSLWIMEAAQRSEDFAASD